MASYSSSNPDSPTSSSSDSPDTASLRELQQYITDRLAELSGSSLYHEPDINVDANPPLALKQVQLKAAIEELQHIQTLLNSTTK